jgi:EAL domain-containing protein (putative c-di-GMP-specific phosphodiesterase class I)
MTCQCTSGDRRLALLVEDLAGSYPELLQFASLSNWERVEERGIVVVPLGPSHAIAARAELTNFLRGILDQPRLERMRCAWVQSEDCHALVPLRLAPAEPLLCDVFGHTSPILEILQQRRIETWIQPVLTAQSFDIWGFECLMRARDAEDQLIAPLDLITWTKRENLLFMLDRVCRELHIERASRLVTGNNLRALINFFPTAIYEPSYCLQTTFAAARRTGIRPEQVIFEVLETEQVRDASHLQRVLAEYRRVGFGVALDDMGSGYAGLELLAELKPDLVKIDRNIVRQVPGCSWHKSICEALVALAHDHHRLVLAEGVETHEEQQAMQRLGVDLLQGFMYAYPVDIDLVEHVEDTLLMPAMIDG